MAIQPLSKPGAATSALNARWEYLTMSYNYSYGSTTYQVNGNKEVRLKNRPLHDVLTLFGQAGWELTSISEGTYVFKRQAVRQVQAVEDVAND